MNDKKHKDRSKSVNVPKYSHKQATNQQSAGNPAFQTPMNPPMAASNPSMQFRIPLRSQLRDSSSSSQSTVLYAFKTVHEWICSHPKHGSDESPSLQSPSHVYRRWNGPFAHERFSPLSRFGSHLQRVFIAASRPKAGADEWLCVPVRSHEQLQSSYSPSSPTDCSPFPLPIHLSLGCRSSSIQPSSPRGGGPGHKRRWTTTLQWQQRQRADLRWPQQHRVQWVRFLPCVECSGAAPSTTSLPSPLALLRLVLLPSLVPHLLVLPLSELSWCRGRGLPALPKSIWSLSHFMCSPSNNPPNPSNNPHSMPLVILGDPLEQRSLSRARTRSPPLKGTWTILPKRSSPSNEPSVVKQRSRRTKSRPTPSALSNSCSLWSFSVALPFIHLLLYSWFTLPSL